MRREKKQWANSVSKPQEEIHVIEVKEQGIQGFPMNLFSKKKPLL